MASIFLSYARGDAAKAGRIANAFEAAGHFVWWDQHIGTGSRFSSEIDEALRNAEMVVVLWSELSIRSAWVLDEAAVGRDTARLVPVLIEDVLPPLGFRQFQALPLTGTLRGKRALQPLLDAVAAGVKPELGVASPVRRGPVVLPRWAMVAMVALLMAGPAYFLFDREPAGDGSTTISVAAAEGGDRRSQELARTVASDLGRYRAGPLGSISILGGGQEVGDLDYRVEVGVSEAGDELRTDISLLAPKSSKILWSTSEQGPAARLVDLRQRALVKLGDVLACAVEVSSHSRDLSAEALGLYLKGCGLMSDHIFFAPNQEIFSVFRQLTERAPEFAPGWARLALIEAQSFPGTPPSERPALRKDLIAHLAKAKQLDATLPETIAADAYFHPMDGTKAQHALGLLDRGLARHPDSALLHHMRALFLGDVGRQNEAITAAERAIGINPLSPGIRDSHISAIAYSGRTAAAYEALKKAEAIWPGSAVLDQVRYRLDLRYGDPRAALRSLQQRGSGDLRPVPGDVAWQAFLEARISPNAANIEKVLDGFRARYRRNHGDVPAYLQALGTFGRVDEAYEVLEPAITLDSMLANTEILFRHHMRPIRADPRFIALAAKLGLVAYWEKTNVWPDFCGEPQLHYDCKQEAAKLTPEQRQVAKLLVN